MPYKPIVLTQKQREQFLKKVLVAGVDDCWEWQGTRQQRGYGQFGAKRLATHRIAYFLSHGADPGKMMVCHTCDNPPCCNPAHLWLGTGQDNQQDCANKYRNRNQIWRAATLNDEQVRFILLSDDSHASLGRTFGVTAECIGQIRRGVSYAHVLPDIPRQSAFKSRGESHGCSKLTEIDVISIRASDKPSKTLAKDYGVAREHIWGIRAGRCWKHLL